MLCYAATQTRSQVTAKRQHIRMPVVTPFFPLDAPQYDPVLASNQQHTLRPYVPGTHDPLEDLQTPIQHPFQRNTTNIPPSPDVTPVLPGPKPFGPFHQEDIPTTKPVLKTNLPDGKLPQPLKVQGPNGSPVNNTGNIDDQYTVPVTQDVNRPSGDVDSIIFPNVTEEDVSLEEPQLTQPTNDTLGIANANNTPDSAAGTANNRWGTQETPAPVYQVPVASDANSVPVQPTPTVINQGGIPYIITSLNPSSDTLKNVAPLTPIQILSNTVPLQVTNAVPTNNLQYNGLCVPSSSSGNIANINGNLYAVLTVPNGNSNLVPCATLSNDYQNNQNVQLVGQYPNNQMSQGTYYAITNPGLVNGQVNTIPTYGVRNGVDPSSSVQGSVPVYVQSHPTATSSPQYIVLNG